MLDIVFNHTSTGAWVVQKALKGDKCIKIFIFKILKKVRVPQINWESKFEV